MFKFDLESFITLECRFALMTALVCLAACASTPLNTLNQGERPTPDTSIVFGSLVDYGLFGAYIEFKNTNDGKTYGLPKTRGLFILKLPPGSYALSTRGIISGSSTSCSKQSAITFSVPANALVYIGASLSDIVSDQYYVDPQSLKHEKSRGPFDYCEVSGLGIVRENRRYKIRIYDNLNVDHAKLLESAPQLKDTIVTNISL